MGLTQMTPSKQFEHNKTQCLLNRRLATHNEALYRPHAIVITKPGRVTPLPYIHIPSISTPSKNKPYRNHENRPCDVTGTLLMIYLLTAIGLSPGGSTHLHTNTT
jgi:hypothetical protein